MSSKEEFSKQLKTKATSFGLLGRKDRGTKIGNLYSCRCGCKLRESKTDKAFTQLNIIFANKNSKAGS